MVANPRGDSSCETIHVSPPLSGNLLTSNKVHGFDVGFKNVRLPKEDMFITKSIQNFISKELRKEILSVKETLRNEIKLELSNINESIKTDLFNGFVYKNVCISRLSNL